MVEIFIIIGLVVLNGLLAMAEIALVSARKVRLEAQANKGNKEAKQALNMANHPETFISTVQIGITLIGLLTGVYSGEKLKTEMIEWLQQFPSLAHYSNAISTTVVVVSIAYVALVLGELVPKRIGLSNPEHIAKIVARPMKVLSWFMYPFIWLSNQSATIIVKMLKIKSNENHVTEEEIKAIISEGTEQGTIEEAEQEIIERVFHLSDRNITSLMTHRTDMEWVEIHKTIGEFKKELVETVHSIYPVCDGNIDNIKGTIAIKDILLLKDDTPLVNAMQTAMYVPENNTAYQVLEKFKATKVHHCFIVDEYGTLQGLITLNDILEAIVGDIQQQDEENYEIVKRDDGSFLIDAQLPFYDFLVTFEKEEWLNEAEHEFDTLAGFILYELQEIPSTGDKLEWRGFMFEIVDMDNNRIDKILVSNVEYQDIKTNNI